jgi:hypothetical protein
MARRGRTISIHFPLGGLNRRYGFQSQPPYTTPLALNIFPTDPSTGRERGGVRPGLTELEARGVAPYAWCPATYLDTTVKTGIAVTFSDGTYTTLDADTWTQRISTAPGTDFATCAIYNGYIFQARGGGTCRQKTVIGGAEAALSNAGGGTAPTNCGLVWVHMDTLALAGDTANPNRVYFSAVNDATNWDASDPVVGSAVTLGGAEGGFVGESVTAAIAHNSSVSLVGSAHSYYAVIGRPSLTSGQIKRANASVGPLMQSAWCKGIDHEGNDNTYMFTADGLYVIPANNYLNPQRLSREKLPNELVGVNPGAGDKVAIGYDQRWPGIHIAVNPNSGSDVNYFYDLQSGGWWPTAYAVTPQLFPAFPKLMAAGKSSVLLISTTGGVNQFDTASVEEFDSYMVLGPIMLGSADMEGKLVGLTAALAKDSQAVNCKAFVGDTVEQAYQAVVADTDPFTLPAWTYSSTRYLNYWSHPLMRGYALFLKIYDISNERWLIEEILAEIHPYGNAPRRVG